MSLPRYPEYKQSNSAWCDVIPGHWQVLTLARVLGAPVTDGPHHTPEFIEEGIPFLSVDAIQEGELVFDGCRFVSLEDHNDFSRKAAPRRNDILMGKAASIGKIARVKTDQPFSIWSPLALIRVDETVCDSVFAEFVLKSSLVQAQIETMANSNTQLNIGMKDIPKLRFALPPRDEQSAIARFLDHETAKIDALIAEQEKLIALLAEKRQATISHAVTRGLNPDAPMKESGVPWLGEVPAHWDVKRLKAVSPEITVGIVVEPSKYYVDVGVPALRSLNVSTGRIIKESLVHISEAANEQLSKSRLRAGDLVSVRSGQTGVTAVVPEELDGCNCIDLIIIRKPLEGSERFLAWYFASDSAVRQFASGSGGAIQQHFNVGMAMNLQVAAPPAAEQLEIATFLDVEAQKLDGLQAEAVRGIALLKERRSALIAAAVTGQIDVRGWQAKPASGGTA